MFENKNLTRISLIAAGALLLSFFATKMNDKNAKNESKEDYEKIQNYLLNESPLYGHNRPKLWIHSKYEVNARQWKDFQSRNTTNLNQSYLHLTIKSVLNYNSQDFNICLIDDDSFRKLIPTWDVDLVNMADPMKSQFRELGMLMCSYYYGGMIIPNSFICLRNLLPLYEKYTYGNQLFVTEKINRINNIQQGTNMYSMIPDTYICGAEKENELMLELINDLQNRLKSAHFQQEDDFKGFVSTWCLQKLKIGKVVVVDGKEVGVKTTKNKPILLEDLMEEDYLDVGKYCYGIYVPGDEVLKRTKYNWLCTMSEDEILASRIAISKYLKVSNVDSLESSSLKSRTVVSI